jgi:tRNA(Arg) A34 adenosine deaminase TadA
MFTDFDHIAMKRALEEAKKSHARDEVPIGAVLVHAARQDIVAMNGNRTIEYSDPTAHAETLVIREECARLGVQRLPDYDLYVTLEPCPMCTSLISFARIRRLIFGASDPKSGGLNDTLHLYKFPQMHHKPQILSGLYADESAQLLKDFFKTKRL